MPTLLTIAKRLLRQGKKETSVIAALEMADALLIDVFEPNSEYMEVLREAQKQNVIEAKAARRFAIEKLRQYADKERQAVFDALLKHVMEEHPEWGRAYVTDIIAAARADVDVAQSGKPISRIMMDLNSKPPCFRCGDKNTENFLQPSTGDTAPMCSGCFKVVWQEGA
jgi:hypothetical protein